MPSRAKLEHPRHHSEGSQPQLCPGGPRAHSVASSRCALLVAWLTIWHRNRKSSSIEGHKIVSFGCAIDAGAHLGSLQGITVKFRRAKVQYGASTNATKSPQSAEPQFLSAWPTSTESVPNNLQNRCSRVETPTTGTTEVNF